MHYYINILIYSLPDFQDTVFRSRSTVSNKKDVGSGSDGRIISKEERGQSYFALPPLQFDEKQRRFSQITYLNTFIRLIIAYFNIKKLRGRIKRYFNFIISFILRILFLLCNNKNQGKNKIKNNFEVYGPKGTFFNSRVALPTPTPKPPLC